MDKIHHQNSQLRLVAWELTRRCNLRCIHCRASAQDEPFSGEFEKDECIDILEQISEVSKPIIILTGGEPLLRDDIFDIARHGSSLGLRMVMATNGTLINKEIAREMKSADIKRVSISIDGPNSDIHDNFRGVEGSFEGSLKGIQVLKEEGIEFQINTTITNKNAKYLKDIINLSIHLGASAHHVFLLVPTGRAKDMKEQQIDADNYEELLVMLYRLSQSLPIHIKATCAPHYYRVLRQEARKEGKEVSYETYGLDAVTRGCLGGISFCFISYDGIIQPCGYLELDCGDLKKDGFEHIWKNSQIFNELRDFSKYKGKCGRCRYIRYCGGCRARAYEVTGDYLAPEPLCSYNPSKSKN